jgi:hypothetical protein
VERERRPVGLIRIWFVKLLYSLPSKSVCLSNDSGGSLVSHGLISVGELTSLLMYTVYVGSGLQMLTYAHPTVLSDNHPHVLTFQVVLCKPMFDFVSVQLTVLSPDIYNAWDRRWDTYF